MIKNLLACVLLSCCTITGFAQQQTQTVNWVNSHALSIATDDYLKNLSAELKDKQLCGLAEASHGTHEFSAEKNRIIRHLITNENYKAVGFEFGYSVMAGINTYLQTGQGDLKALMKQLYLFKTKEIFDLFTFIKTYNDTQQPQNKVMLFGFDTNYFPNDITDCAGYCVAYVASHQHNFAQAKQLIATFKKIVDPEVGLYSLEDEEYKSIDNLNKQLKTRPRGDEDLEKFRKYVSLLYQGTQTSNPLARDEFMAENIIDMQQQNHAKTIIWGHNVHLAKDTTMAACKGMGYYLKQHYQDKYYAIGFDTYKGTVNVLADGQFSAEKFTAAQGSFSAMFATAKLPGFFLPLSKPAGNPLYNKTGDITNIYANWSERIALPVRPGVDFNSLIFIRETTASVPLQ